MFVLSLKGRGSKSCALKFSLHLLQADLESVWALGSAPCGKKSNVKGLASGPVLSERSSMTEQSKDCR